MNKGRTLILLLVLVCLSLLAGGSVSDDVGAQSSGPEMLVPNLAVRTTVADLITPISMAFIGNNDFRFTAIALATDVDRRHTGRSIIAAVRIARIAL